MIVLWLIVWLLCHTPDVDFSPLNKWAVSLVVCILVDILD